MLRIMIDPGHTKKVNAGVIKGYYEGDAMYKLGKYLADALAEFEGVETFLTRGENEDPTLAERGKKAIDNQCKVFISLHSNAVGNAESASYVCGFYSVKRKASANLCGELVKSVTEVMEDTTDAWSKGALTKMASSGEDYYGVIRNSVAGNSPVEYSFLIEHGFHTNKKECNFLMKDANLKAIAHAEAKVFADYFGLKAKEKTIAKVLYRVQIGAYQDAKNAQTCLEKAKNAGFKDAFITTTEVEMKPTKTVEDLAKEIINGNWGSGHATREAKLKEAGWLEFYTYEEIRAKVNELSK